MLADILLAIPDAVFNTVFYMDELVGVIGGILIGVGFAGRRHGWGPRCRACHFDLRAVPEGSAKCPECGASLAGKRAIRFGVRARRWGMVGVGVLIVAFGAFSTVSGLPYMVMSWRQNVLASAFTFDRLIDLSLAGNMRAVSELQGELNGTGRQRRTSGNPRPGQDALAALLDRMEADPSTRTVLLPLAATPMAFSWGRESNLTLRLAKLLCDVAATDTALLRSLPAASLNQIFQTGNQGAIAQLLSSQPMVTFLYSGSGPAQRISDAPVALVIRPTFGGSAPDQGLWTHNSTMALEIADAAWRNKGEPDSAWRTIERRPSRPMTAEAEITVVDAPASGTIEVRVHGALARRTEGADGRTPRARRSARARQNEQSTQGDPAAPTLTFEWRQDVVLKPRSEVIMTPVSPRSVGTWIADGLGATMLVTSPEGTPGEYVLLSEIGTNLNGSAIWLQGTLEQAGRTWPGETADPYTGDARIAFKPEGFDPAKPFAVRLQPDLMRLRARATSDGTYFDVRTRLTFDAANKPPRSIEDIATDEPD